MVDDGKEQIVEVEEKKTSQSQRTTTRTVPSKTVKKPLKFKLGTWNPDTVLVEEEFEKLGHSEEPNFETGHHCNTRNLIRAINTNNFTLLKKCIADKENIHSLEKPWSEDSDDLLPM